MSPATNTESITVPLSVDEQWTLHHVLLDRVEREAAVGEDSTPPTPAVFRAFETIDSGEIQFSMTELEAMQSVLAEYHHRTSWWELERSQIECVLHQVTEALDERYVSQ